MSTTLSGCTAHCLEHAVQQQEGGGVEEKSTNLSNEHISIENKRTHHIHLLELDGSCKALVQLSTFACTVEACTHCLCILLYIHHQDYYKQPSYLCWIMIKYVRIQGFRCTPLFS